MQKNSVSLKEVLTRMYKRVSRMLIDNTSTAFARTMRKVRENADIGDCQYRRKHCN